MNDTWKEFALCKGHIKLFFSADSNATAQKPSHRRKYRARKPNSDTMDKVVRCKEICKKCPVIEQCLDYALVTKQQFGVWGGLAWYEREDMLLNRRYKQSST